MASRLAESSHEDWVLKENVCPEDGDAFYTEQRGLQSALCTK